MKEDLDTLTLQIGVLMAAVGSIAREVGASNPQFAASLADSVHRVYDAMLAKGVSETSLQLARGTIDSILSGLPGS